MKKIYKTLMTLAAALLLVPTAFAQTDSDPNHEKYLLDEDKGIGYNKYLTSRTPDENGYYTLRIENFITGEVKPTALPTDFVLVIDNSGSMYYDYRPYGLTNRPNRIPLTDEGLAENSNEKLLLPYLIEGYGASDVSVNFQPYTGMSYTYEYQLSTVGASPTSQTARYFYVCTAAEGTNYGVGNYSTRYYRYEDSTNPDNSGYYKIFRKLNGSYRNLAIKLADGTYRYLYGNSIQTEPNSSITTDTQIIYNGGNVYHVKSRQEALLDGAQSFINTIAAQNAITDQWKPGVTKHQLALVSFSVGYADGTASVTEYPSALPANDTKVIKSFGEVDDAATWYNYVKNRMTFRGGQTAIDRGVNLARMLLDDLQSNSTFAPLNGTGDVKRKKVVVVFTDGEPYDTGRNYLQITQSAINYGNTIKEVGPGKLNGRIYTIDLCMSLSTERFLGHLSSNYPKAATASQGNFTGKEIPLSQSDVSATEWKYLKGETKPIYYKNTKDGDLSSVFSSIAGDNTGAMTSTLVAVDVMSDDFTLPFTSDDTDKVTMYTAQCIGKKSIDGKEYLAFAEPVKVSERPALRALWVLRPAAAGSDEKVWVNLGQDNDFDIDNRMKFEVIKETDPATGQEKNKSIVVSGFDYADLWCGHDGDHENTRQIETTDPNFDYQLDGYRGFKMIFEFPIKIDENALGGVDVPTNDWAHSGLYQADGQGNPQGDPEVNYPTPDLPVPVRLVIKKTGLKPGESANFTVQRRTRVEGSEWEDYTTFVLTGDANNTPEVRIINLNPNYFYKVKEENWSWAYTNVHPEYTTEPDAQGKTISNPIVFENDPIPTPPPHAEAKATNKMTTWEGQTSSTETVNSK